jgi:hypothetical protein
MENCVEWGCLCARQGARLPIAMHRSVCEPGHQVASVCARVQVIACEAGPGPLLPSVRSRSSVLCVVLAVGWATVRVELWPGKSLLVVRVPSSRTTDPSRGAARPTCSTTGPRTLSITCTGYARRQHDAEPAAQRNSRPGDGVRASCATLCDARVVRAPQHLGPSCRGSVLVGSGLSSIRLCAARSARASETCRRTSARRFQKTVTLPVYPRGCHVITRKVHEITAISARAMPLRGHTAPQRAEPSHHEPR